MTFEEILDQAIAMLQRRGRLTYGALKRQFQLDDAYLEDLKAELIEGQRLAVDEDGRVLVWTGGASTPLESDVSPLPHHEEPLAAPHTRVASPAAAPPPDAERRQLTVLFCDLVDSTVLASQLDPEDLREVVRAYQDTCAKVIARFEGYIAQYLGDGLLVYFGYPLAHEDDAQRAVRAGLGMVEALGQLNIRLKQERGVALAVRLGIHTGLVVVGEVGGGARQEQLALGETPNLAARLQGVATPNTVVISAATVPLLGGFFACQSLGTPSLKGLAQPLEVYRVLYESTARSRLEAAGSAGLTPLVGREQEVALLRERWAQVKDGIGQVVADALGVPLDHIEVVHGNTDVVPYGMGTFGSRSLAVGGAAVQMSVEKIKDKARQLAAYMLDVRPEDVTYGDGAIYVTADPGRQKTLAEVAFAATDFNWQLQGGVPAGLEPGLEATSRFEPANGTCPFGTHICVVEVDRETGAVELKRYVAVDDCGNVINPLIVDGQVHGGIAQGLAQALYEEVVYDAHGQLVTGSLMDYAVPKAHMLPTIETDRTVTPTLLNPLGAKGIGEAGTSGSAPAVANAIIDALAPFGVTHLEMPFKPEKLWRLMHQGTQA